MLPITRRKGCDATISAPPKIGLSLMCRSIKTLRYRDERATEEEVRAAALQFVRKVSGFRQPSKKNQGSESMSAGSLPCASK